MKTKYQIGQLLEYVYTANLDDADCKTTFSVIEGIIQRKDGVSYLMESGNRVDDVQIKNVYVLLPKPRTRVRRKPQPENAPDLPG